MHIRASVLCSLATAALSAAAAAQCGPQWLPAPAALGPSGTVRAVTMWDPDGPGPRAPMLIIGGAFTTAGGATVNNIAAWNGETWTSLAGGVTGSVVAPDTISGLATLPGGDLVAAGVFQSAGGVAANNIARW